MDFQVTANSAVPILGSETERFAREVFTILVIDANLELRRASTTILRHAGYLVVEAADGVEAKQKTGGELRVDLLVTDMPLQAGEILPLIRWFTETFPRAGILVATKSITEARRWLGKNRRCRWLERPFAPFQFLEAVGQALASTCGQPSVHFPGSPRLEMSALTSGMSAQEEFTSAC